MDSSSKFLSDLEKAKRDINFEHTFREPQTAALKAFYDSKDSICLLPTGGGKSVIYQITPFLAKYKLNSDSGLITIVISPLNAIMYDQVLKLTAKGIKACYVDMAAKSGHSFGLKKRNSSDIEDSDDSDQENNNEPEKVHCNVSFKSIEKGDYNIIYCHPEALLSTKQGQKLLNSSSFQKKVVCVAIDEAHMIQQWYVTKLNILVRAVPEIN